jgi:hypothetical protein
MRRRLDVLRLSDQISELQDVFLPLAMPVDVCPSTRPHTANQSWLK